MLGLRAVAFCRESGVFWYVDDEPPKCDAEHEHPRSEMHVHRDRVALPGAGHVTAATFDDRAPYERDTVPAYGLYLDARWQPPWPHDLVEWPDFGLPADPHAFRAMLSAALGRVRSGEVVEIGCWGGHGRTGVALACLGVLAGVDPAEATSWVRTAYCPKAVETPEQEAYVVNFGAP